MSPGMARLYWEAIQRLDVRHVLPAITAPTLVHAPRGLADPGLAGTARSRS